MKNLLMKSISTRNEWIEWFEDRSIKAKFGKGFYESNYANLLRSIKS